MSAENNSKPEVEKDAEVDTLGGFTAEDITDEMVEKVEEAVGERPHYWGEVSPKEIIAASANIVLDDMQIEAEEDFEDDESEACGMDFRCSNVGGALAPAPRKPWYEITSDAISSATLTLLFIIPLSIKLWAWAGPDLAKLIAQLRTSIH